MMDILPISDLNHYGEVLSRCDEGSVVCLTKNGRGKTVAQNLIEYEKLQATVKLLAGLGRGVMSVQNEGTLSVDEAFAGLEV